MRSFDMIAEVAEVAMLIVGCGSVGRTLAQSYLENDGEVRGLVRSVESAKRLQQQGITPFTIDLDRADYRLPETGGELIFYLAPPRPVGTSDSRLERFLQALQYRGRPRRIVHLSTSGVYGDCRGEWVDEGRPPNPSVDRARRRWDGEQRVVAWQRDTGVELVILRVAGIYGPGRLPLARLRKNLPMVSPAEAPWTNRIHIDDLVQVLCAAAEQACAGEVFNVSDGRPDNMANYFNLVADRAGLPRPPVIPLAEAGGKLSKGLHSYLAESRRLNNRKMLEQLGVKLKFPTLERGIEDCLTD